MNPGDRLHQFAVAVGKTLSVNSFHPAGVGFSVIGDGNAVFAMQNTGHAVDPKFFVADVPVGEPMQFSEKGQEIFDAVGHRCDELKQCLRVVGRDVAVGKCRTQGDWMRLLGQHTLGINAKALLFKSPAHGG